MPGKARYVESEAKPIKTTFPFIFHLHSYFRDYRTKRSAHILEFLGTKLPGIILLSPLNDFNIFLLEVSLIAISGCRVVESVGEGVTEVREGDHVVPAFNGECGECVYCKSEKTNLCERFRVNPFKSVMINDGRSRFATNDGKQPIFHFLNTSTFTEYTVVDSACVVKLPPEAPLTKMTLLSCGVSTGLSSNKDIHIKASG